MKPLGHKHMNCSYCGVSSNETRIVRDHFVPKARGGPHKISNLVPACDACNRLKSDELFAEARYKLLQRRLGWPVFNTKQLAWLRSNGFDVTKLDSAKLYFEENEGERFRSLARVPKPLPVPRRKVIRQYLRNQALMEGSRHMLDLALPKHMRKVIWNQRQ